MGALGDTPLDTAERISQRLLGELRNARGHDNFTGNSAADLFYQVNLAANRMIKEERTGPGDLDEAANAMVALLTEMEGVRSQRGYSEFREDTVMGALDLLCPGFWPFC